MEILLNSNNVDEIIPVIEQIMSSEMIIPKEYHFKVFLRSCNKGYLDIVKLLIGNIEINGRGEHNFTPFLYACFQGHLEIVKLLLATPGFNSLNTPNDRNITPFYYACNYNHLEIAKLLISTPGFDSLNTPNIYNETPFSRACFCGYLEMAKLLIATPGFNSLNTPDKYRRMPIYHACIRNKLEVITLLLLQDDLIRPIVTNRFSEEVKNRIIDVDANRNSYMKKYKTSLIIDIYRLTVFLSDNYLEIKSSSFFKIIKELPTELQIKIIFATVNWNQTYILTEDFNDGLKEFVKKLIINL
jgi:ankyrin repeat protein